MLLTELGLVSKSLAPGRMAGVHHKTDSAPFIQVFFGEFFFSKFPNTKSKRMKFNTFVMLEFTCNANVAEGVRLMLYSQIQTTC